MLCVPHCDQLVAGLANVLGVNNVTPKRAFLIHHSIYALVGLDVDLVFAVQADTERIDSASGADRASIQQQAGEGLDLAFLYVLGLRRGGVFGCCCLRLSSDARLGRVRLAEQPVVSLFQVQQLHKQPRVAPARASRAATFL